MEVKALILPKQSAIDQMYSELGTSEAKIAIDLKILKEWMRKQPHLPNPDDGEKTVDEKRIKMFLILCKNSMEKTKVKLDQHYTVKRSAPEYFSKWDPTSPELIQSMKLSFFVPLPNPTHEGHRVVLYSARTAEDVDKFVYDDFIKSCFITYDLRIAHLDTCKKDIYILDTINLSMNHMTVFLLNVKKTIECMFAAYPTRIHEIHIVNKKSFLQPLLNIVIRLLKKKISNRIFNHNSIEELKNYIDPSILPLNYGGSYPKTSDEVIDEWYVELTKHREWLIAQESIVADKSKRPKNSNTNLDSFKNATEGSFRKLEVD
ncbi:alpha-tocopherol transfer protein-like isoform X2 [Adelges cooleyi]|uniref:alpha-tocopherol transfer protein-like isoform X2 n=1 Tax=Adelges cooleyi TaxID=133065 RepID=UPI00218062F4|nr:alpha-tocopherol transfer protein-like isoform X2 [Adelges cooleyi]